MNHRIPEAVMGQPLHGIRRTAASWPISGTMNGAAQIVQPEYWLPSKPRIACPALLPSAYCSNTAHVSLKTIRVPYPARTGLTLNRHRFLRCSTSANLKESRVPALLRSKSNGDPPRAARRTACGVREHSGPPVLPCTEAEEGRYSACMAARRGAEHRRPDRGRNARGAFKRMAGSTRDAASPVNARKFP